MQILKVQLAEPAPVTKLNNLFYTLRAVILPDPVLPYKQYYTTVLNHCQLRNVV